MAKLKYKIQLNEKLFMTADIVDEFKLCLGKNTAIERISDKKLGYILGFICADTSASNRGKAYYCTFDNRSTPILYEDEFKVISGIKDKADRL